MAVAGGDRRTIRAPATTARAAWKNLSRDEATGGIYHRSNPSQGSGGQKWEKSPGRVGDDE